MAPAAESQAQLFVNLDTTFAALARSPPFIQESISEGPETLDTAIRELPHQRPFLANTEGLFRELRPGAEALRAAAPDLADALVAGTRTLPKTPPFNRQVAELLQTLQEFSEDPLVPPGIRRLTEHGQLAGPDARLPGARADPVQLRDAVVPQRLVAAERRRPQRHLAALHHHRHAAGPEQRGHAVVGARQRARRVDNHLHTNPYPNTAAPGQPKECEAANEPYARGRTVVGNPPGTQSRRRRRRR